MSTTRIRNCSDGQKASWLLCQTLVFVGVDVGRCGNRTWFQQPLDKEARLVQLFAGPLQRREPVPHMPASTPRLFDDAGLEVVAAVTKPIAGGVLARKDQRPFGSEHTPEFPQGECSVIDILKGQREQHHVNRLGGQPVKRVSQVVSSKLRCGHSTLRQLNHPGALVEADHVGATNNELLGVQARTTCRVEDRRPLDVAQQRKARWPVVIGIEQAAASMVEEFVGEDVVLGIRSNGIRHSTICTPELCDPDCSSGPGS